MSNLFKGGPLWLVMYMTLDIAKFLLMIFSMFQVNLETKKLRIRSEIHIQVWKLTQHNY
jgi:hypothetical protein